MAFFTKISTITILFLCILIKNNNVIGKLHNAYHGTWCDPKLCHNSGEKHVACGNTGSLGSKCPSDAVVIDVKPFKDYFLHEHNRLRNKIAMGYVPGYKSAARMATMSWDDELAYLASLNAKTCTFDHDKCYNTYRFRNTGQSLAGLWNAKDRPLNMTKLISEAAAAWFEEHELIDMSYIDNFRIESNFEDYGHFTEFVVDRNTHVGCAAVRFSVKDYPFYYRINIVCDYASVHSSETPVYESGVPASKCTTGSNAYYPGLCSPQEYFNPNIYNYELIL
ncbi:antigen 5 like allergen Cul n 1-like [Condylostylus longicornis]|uniref:antigen 5 like allergen Cul n 1-like n=1 Tax=Condylostylus longicornis TaxID=2530218 RepID=UPI00244E3997|nr:antigen 5 like allergen Cul n 1-like [Condylostylus longicornis]